MLQLSLDLNQRWAEGRASYRPIRDVIRTSEFEVAEMHDDTTAREFILTRHYSGSYPAARFRVGLCRQLAMVGTRRLSIPDLCRVNPIKHDGIDGADGTLSKKKAH
jgi:hypothetical protein